MSVVLREKDDEDLHFVKHVLNAIHLCVQLGVNIAPHTSLGLAHVGDEVLNALIQGLMCIAHSSLKSQVMSLGDLVFCILLVVKDQVRCTFHIHQSN